MAKAKPINIGIIGIGRAGWGMHCKELAVNGRDKKFKIVAACDVIPKRRKMMEEKYGCETYRNAIDLINDPDVELVDIATPSPLHTEQALAALQAGKLVFQEKPVAMTYKEAKKIEAAAKKSKGAIWFRHNRRFEPTFQHIRELLATGIIGDVFEVKLCRGGYQRRDDWQTLIKCGGGQLCNWGPHIIDHALQFLDSPVKEQWSNLASIACAGDAEDHVRITLKGENGRVCELKISGGCTMREPTYLINGTKGGLTSDEKTIKLKYLDPKKKLKPRRAKSRTPEFGGFGSKDDLKWIEKEIPVKPKLKVTCDAIWDYLYDAIRKGKTFPVSTAEAVNVMKVISEAKKGTKF